MSLKKVDVSRIEEWGGPENLGLGYCRERLCEIVWLLYAIRNNLFHGRKETGENDKNVVSNANPVLYVICDQSITHYDL